MTASAPRTSEWTLDDLDAIPEDGNRHEIIEGSLLVSPMPALPHLRALSRLQRLLIRQAPDRSVPKRDLGRLPRLEP